MHERLMLVALEWPSSLSPASSPTLTHSEREVLAKFRCREAEVRVRVRVRVSYP